MLSPSQLEQLYGQLKVMDASGVPVVDSLTILATHSPHRQGAMLKRVGSRVSKGLTLGDAFAREHDIPAIDRELIAIGEFSGGLEEIFRLLEEESHLRVERRNQIIEVLWYPILLLYGALMLPQLYLNFTSGFGAYLASCWPVAVLTGLLLGVVYGLPKAKRHPGFSNAWTRFWGSLPMTAKVSRMVSWEKYCRTMGLCLKAGVPMFQAMELGARAAEHAMVEREVLAALSGVRDGRGYAESLRRAANVPADVLLSLSTGEAAGKLEETHLGAARSLQRQTGELIKRIIRAVGVIVFLLVAVYIAIVVISFYSRYFSMLSGGIPDKL